MPVVGGAGAALTVTRAGLAGKPSALAPSPYAGLSTPNIESNPTYDGQSQPDQTDFQALSFARGGLGVVGLPNSWQVQPVFATPGMQVTVSPGGGLAPGVGPVWSQNPVTLTIPPAFGGDRKDIIVYDTFGWPNNTGVAVIRGQENQGIAGQVWTRTNNYGPVKPLLTPYQILLAEIYVPYNATQITASNILDKRTPVDSTGTTLAEGYYAPIFANATAAKTYTINGGPPAGNKALDSSIASLSVQFAAPGSGRVRVEQSATLSASSTGNDQPSFGVFTHGTTTLVGVWGAMCTGTNAANVVVATEQIIQVNPGQIYWWDFAWFGNANATYIMYVGSQSDTTLALAGRPVILRVSVA